MADFSTRIVNSGRAQVVDTSGIAENYANSQQRATQKREKKEEESRQAYIKSQEELRKIQEKTYGEDTDRVNKAVMEASEELADLYNSDIDMNSPEALKERDRLISEIKSKAGNATQWQEHFEQGSDFIENSKYVQKQQAQAELIRQNQLPPEERDYDLVRQIMAGEKFYDFGAEIKDIAYGLERTNMLKQKDKYNMYDIEYAEGYEYDEETEAWKASEELIDRILSGELGNERLVGYIEGQVEKIKGDEFVLVNGYKVPLNTMSDEELKRQILHQELDAYHQAKTELIDVETAKAYRPTTYDYNNAKQEEFMKQAHVGFNAVDNGTLSMFIDKAKNYGWQFVPAGGGKYRVKFKWFKKADKKPRATDPMFNGIAFDPNDEASRQNAINELIKAQNRTYIVEDEEGEEPKVEDKPVVSEEYKPYETELKKASGRVGNDINEVVMKTSQGNFTVGYLLEQGYSMETIYGYMKDKTIRIQN